MSLIGLLDLSTGALRADQTAVNATANNVANQNTAGYTDEQVTWTPGVVVSLSGDAQSTTAPTVTTTSLRDRILEQRVQQQTQTQSSTASEAAVLSQIEGVFSLTGSSATAGSTQIGTSLNAFFSSLSALAANPSDEPTQQSALSAAQTLASAFNAAASGLSGVQNDLNSTVASSITSVNQLTAQIASLNKEIGMNDPNQDAGQLEDQRQQAIAQLSQLIGLDQATTESNGMTLTTTAGTVLVAGENSYALQASVVGGKTVLYDSEGNQLQQAPTGGSIGGQLQAQSVDLPSVTSQLDALAYRIGTSFNTQNEAGQTSAGAAGAALFQVPLSQTGAAIELSVIPSDPGAIATASTGQGSSSNGNVSALASLASATDASGTTMDQNLATMLSGVGATSAMLQQESTSQQDSLTQLTTQRDTLSAVNLDTEASNLTIFQRSYEAAAKVFSIADQLLADALNLGEQATVT
jgi:flagellar hook-associated protein 1 FlgK